MRRRRGLGWDQPDVRIALTVISCNLIVIDGILSKLLMKIGQKGGPDRGALPPPSPLKTPQLSPSRTQTFTLCTHGDVKAATKGQCRCPW